MQHEKRTDLLAGRTIWVFALDNRFDDRLTLLISKVSEAVLPDTEGNHIGHGSTMDEFIRKQPGVRFLINGGFSHYRKNFYDWPHQDYHVGDPVGLVKIRDHTYEDFRDRTNFGFFVQRAKHEPWRIVLYEELDKAAKYILGCTPLLIYRGEVLSLPADKMLPLESGKITPPSILAHGLQRHPRTAIGLKDGQIVFLVVEGDDNTGGCTLLELQEVGRQLGLRDFLNLDGGGSSQFRLWQGDHYLKNAIAPEDANRILGHVLVLFDETLKP